MHKNKVNVGAGFWSAVGTFVLVAYVALTNHPIKEYLSGFWGFMNGDLPVAESGNLFCALPEILTTAVITIPLSLVAGIVVFTLFVAKDKSGHAVSELLTNLKPGNNFALFFLLVAAEEVTARWFFLDLLPKIKFLSSPTMYFILMVIGNSLWSYWHLSNFKEGNKHIALVLPQFLTGFLYAYIFTKYGLAASILAHFTHNAIIFASQKLQKVNWVDFLSMGFYGAIALASYLLLNRPLSDALEWVDGDTVFVIEGWTFWSYLWFTSFVSSTLGLITGVLLYDDTLVRQENKKKGADAGATMVAVILIMILTPAIIIGVYKLVGLVVTDTVLRVLLIGIGLMLLGKSPSVNAAMRQFWTGIPSTYMTVAVVAALGFWPAVGFMFVDTALSLPSLVLRYLND